MRTECNPTSMRFARLKGREVVADFGGGSMTTDAGALLLGATDAAGAGRAFPYRERAEGRLRAISGGLLSGCR